MVKRKAILSVILVISFSGWANAEDPVLFTDLCLKYAVENELGADPTPTDMLDLIYLDASYSDILHLGGLEYAVNLIYLDANSNWIGDLSPIAGLVELKWLYLENNYISDVSALSGLTNLQLLSLDDNGISDISALAPLTSLQTLWLYNNQIDKIVVLALLTNLIELDLGANQISDISSIGLLTKLDLLDLDWNPLNTPAYCKYLPLIQLNNPLNTELLYDPNPNPFTDDCSTDMTELAQWSLRWLDVACTESNNFCHGADLDHIRDVTLHDFAQFAELWLRGP